MNINETTTTKLKYSGYILYNTETKLYKSTTYPGTTKYISKAFVYKNSKAVENTVKTLYKKKPSWNYSERQDLKDSFFNANLIVIKINRYEETKNVVLVGENDTALAATLHTSLFLKGL